MEDEKKINPALTKKITKLLENGNTVSDVCAVVGITLDQYNSWRDTDEGFKKKTDQSTALARQFHLENIRIAGTKDWKASAWFLERTSPKDFGQKSIEPIEGKHGGKPINIQIITGNGYVPPVRSLNVTSEGSIIPDTPEIQSINLAQTGPQDDDSSIRVDKAKSA